MPAGQNTVCSIGPQGRWWYGANTEEWLIGNQKKATLINQSKILNTSFTPHS